MRRTLIVGVSGLTVVESDFEEEIPAAEALDVTLAVADTTTPVSLPDTVCDAVNDEEGLAAETVDVTLRLAVADASPPVSLPDTVYDTEREGLSSVALFVTDLVDVPVADCVKESCCCEIDIVLEIPSVSDADHVVLAMRRRA